MLAKKRSAHTNSFIHSLCFSYFEMLMFEFQVCKDKIEEIKWEYSLEVIIIGEKSTCSCLYFYSSYHLKQATRFISHQFCNNNHIKEGSNPIVNIFSEVYKRLLKHYYQHTNTKRNTCEWNWSVEILSSHWTILYRA